MAANTSAAARRWASRRRCGWAGSAATMARRVPQSVLPPISVPILASFHSLDTLRMPRVSEAGTDHFERFPVLDPGQAEAGFEEAAVGVPRRKLVGAWVYECPAECRGRCLSVTLAHGPASSAKARSGKLIRDGSRNACRLRNWKDPPLIERAPNRLVGQSRRRRRVPSPTPLSEFKEISLGQVRQPAKPPANSRDLAPRVSWTLPT